jgi:hypothetical protein
MSNHQELYSRELNETEVNNLRKELLSSPTGLIDMSKYHPRKGKIWFINLNNVIHITMTEKDRDSQNPHQNMEMPVPGL